MIGLFWLFYLWLLTRLRIGKYKRTVIDLCLLLYLWFYSDKYKFNVIGLCILLYIWFRSRLHLWQRQVYCINSLCIYDFYYSVPNTSVLWSASFISFYLWHLTRLCKSKYRCIVISLLLYQWFLFSHKYKFNVIGLCLLLYLWFLFSYKYKRTVIDLCFLLYLSFLFRHIQVYFDRSLFTTLSMVSIQSLLIILSIASNQVT